MSYNRGGNLFLRITAVIFSVYAVVAVAIPDPYIELLGVDSSAGGRLWGRAWDAVGAGFGVMLLLIDQSDQLQGRLGFIGATIAYALTGLTDIVSVTQGDLPTYGWVFRLQRVDDRTRRLLLQQHPVDPTRAPIHRFITGWAAWLSM